MSLRDRCILSLPRLHDGLARTPPAANDEIPAESNVGSAMNVDGVGIAADGGGPSRWEEHVAPNEVLDV